MAKYEWQDEIDHWGGKVKRITKFILWGKKRKKMLSNQVIPCKTLLELTVGWAAGALANDTTLAITGVESFLSDGGPAEAAGTMEILAV